MYWSPSHRLTPIVMSIWAPQAQVRGPVLPGEERERAGQQPEPAVRAENRIHGFDQQSCSPGAPPVMITPSSPTSAADRPREGARGSMRWGPREQPLPARRHVCCALQPMTPHISRAARGGGHRRVEALPNAPFGAARTARRPACTRVHRRISRLPRPVAGSAGNVRPVSAGLRRGGIRAPRSPQGGPAGRWRQAEGGRRGRR